MDNATRAALVSSDVFTEDDLGLLEAGEADRGSILNWSARQFADCGLDKAKAIAAQSIIAQAKVGVAVEDMPQIEIPEQPPYLDTQEIGVPGGYSPFDPSQYYIDPDTDEMWRWDGKRQLKNVEKFRNELNQPLDRNAVNRAFPWGEPHRVILVRHHNIGGVLVPDPDEAAAANLAGYDWFHQGYGCWVGNGGSAYSDVDSLTRRRVIEASRTLLANGLVNVAGRA